VSSAYVSLFWQPLAPVIALVAAGMGLITLECFPENDSRLRAILRTVLTLGGAALALGLVLWLKFPTAETSVPIETGAEWLRQMPRFLNVDGTSWAFFGAIALFTLLSAIFSLGFFDDSESKSEIQALILFISAGMMLLVSANHLLMVFLALELLSLPTYVLVGIQRKNRLSSEAALKYFLFGSFATVFLLLGIALLYAQFATMTLPELARGISAGGRAPAEMAFTYGGMALILAAGAFKVGAVPFHMWVPDVYQGAPTPITGYMGAAIKLAGFGLLLRLTWGLFGSLAGEWTKTLLVISALTMVIGNLAALAQTNLKRLFAYSSVSHAGYLLLGLCALPAANHSALFFYLVVYGLMFLGLFGILALVEKSAKNVEIYTLSGMGFTHPVYGGLVALFALSAAGIPPTAGFLAKYLLLLDAVRAGYTPWVVVAVLSSLIGAYYYLRVLVYLYMKESKETLSLKAPSWSYLWAVGFCAACLILLTLLPGNWI